jgi:hypothetical protein
MIGGHGSGVHAAVPQALLGWRKRIAIEQGESASGIRPNQ